MYVVFPSLLEWILHTLLTIILVSDMFGEGWFKPFVLINMYGVNAVVMIIEMLFLNSIKRPMVRHTR